MASEDTDNEDRTEDATPKKLEKLREDGVVPKSQDVGAAVALTLGLAVLAHTSLTAAEDVRDFARHVLEFRDVHSPLPTLSVAARLFLSAVMPVAVALGIGSFLAGLAQTQGFVSFEHVFPKLERLDPLKGIQKVLPGPEVLTDLGKTVLKTAVLGVVVARVVVDALPRLILASRRPPLVATLEVCSIAGRLLLHGTFVFVLLAAVDYFLAYRRFQAQSRMTKQEIKDEHKEQEGDPKIKGKRRARAMQIARQRSVGAVKDATVLLTNPTHLSVALRYRPGEDHAPILIAKGEDDVALEMRTEARKHGVPIIENKPLARAMYATGKLGRAIPVELYEAVAEIIAHVLRIRGSLPAR